MIIFALLQIFEKNGPIIIQMRLEGDGILEVHLLNILFLERDIKETKLI